MEEKLTAAIVEQTAALAIRTETDIARASEAARRIALKTGFPRDEADEIALAVMELATNLVRHAHGGAIQIHPLESPAGVEVISNDAGPGIADVERALTDGYSTSGSLGNGLGAVNRVMDSLEFSSAPGGGLRVVCRRSVRPKRRIGKSQIECGAAARSYHMLPENGDAIVLRQWDDCALAGIIDGLGHGPHAQHAAQSARHYIEQHFDQPLEALFRGADRACRATRGVVMQLARFEFQRERFLLAGIGNTVSHLVGCQGPFRPALRRGIIGATHTPPPVATEHFWRRGCVLIMHSDGVSSQWQADEPEQLQRESAALSARRLLQRYGSPNDDASVLVIKHAAS